MKSSKIFNIFIAIVIATSGVVISYGLINLTNMQEPQEYGRTVWTRDGIQYTEIHEMPYLTADPTTYLD